MEILFLKSDYKVLFLLNLSVQILIAHISVKKRKKILNFVGNAT